MKKIVTLLFIGLISLSINAQKNQSTIKTNPNAGIFEFETEVLDYGTIAYKSDGVRSFVFKNVGKSPIIITKARGACGCTIPTIPKKPVMPGETAEIGVKYDTSRKGPFSKTITIYSNASKRAKVITIKGNILKGNNKSKESLEKPKNILEAN